VAELTENDSTDITLAGRSFKICGPTTGKPQLGKLDSLMGGSTRQQVAGHWSNRLWGRSETD